MKASSRCGKFEFEAVFADALAGLLEHQAEDQRQRSALIEPRRHLPYGTALSQLP